MWRLQANRRTDLAIGPTLPLVTVNISETGVCPERVARWEREGVGQALGDSLEHERVSRKQHTSGLMNWLGNDLAMDYEENVTYRIPTVVRNLRFDTTGGFIDVGDVRRGDDDLPGMALPIIRLLTTASQASLNERPKRDHCTTDCRDRSPIEHGRNNNTSME